MSDRHADETDDSRVVACAECGFWFPLWQLRPCYRCGGEACAECWNLHEEECAQ